MSARCPVETTVYGPEGEGWLWCVYGKLEFTLERHYISGFAETIFIEIASTYVSSYCRALFRRVLFLDSSSTNVCLTTGSSRHSHATVRLTVRFDLAFGLAITEVCGTEGSNHLARLHVAPSPCLIVWCVRVFRIRPPPRRETIDHWGALVPSPISGSGDEDYDFEACPSTPAIRGSGMGPYAAEGYPGGDISRLHV